jgi:hypothetical protein
MARRSARQITPTLSDDSGVLLAERDAIGESLGRASDGVSYHICPSIERLNCMQFAGPIAQKESGQSHRPVAILLIWNAGLAGIRFACTSSHDAHAARF